MIKLFIGGKGSGKTKTLIELVNNAANTSNGSVVCIEKGNKLTYDISHSIRLIDVEEYRVTGYPTLFFINREGKIVKYHEGFSASMEEEVEKQIQKMLKK